MITVESIGGGNFDSLVFAEKQKAKWMAGSNNSVRTQNVDGPAETTKPGELIHLAIVYQPDGRIALFRNGQPYGTGYAPPMRRQPCMPSLKTSPACSLVDATPEEATPSYAANSKKPVCMASR